MRKMRIHGKELKIPVSNHISYSKIEIDGKKVDIVSKYPTNFGELVCLRRLKDIPNVANVLGAEGFFNVHIVKEKLLGENLNRVLNLRSQLIAQRNYDNGKFQEFRYNGKVEPDLYPWDEQDGNVYYKGKQITTKHDISDQLTETVVEIHNRNISGLDIIASNIIISKEGTMQLFDFDSAQIYPFKFERFKKFVELDVYDLTTIYDTIKDRSAVAWGLNAKPTSLDFFMHYFNLI